MDYKEFRISCKNTKALLIGDIMLDRYVFGKVNRISPEAPVPIFLAKDKKQVLNLNEMDKNKDGYVLSAIETYDPPTIPLDENMHMPSFLGVSRFMYRYILLRRLSTVHTGT